MSAFVIQFSPQALDHLKYFSKRDQQIILNAIEKHLSDRPDQETRKRKRLEENPLAPWELRVGDFRVFYDVDSDNHLVIIVAIGMKNHNILRIAGKEVQL
jgi:mRNA-degrading endonuclease RelE of RelBE toxin-antitoxin system